MSNAAVVADLFAQALHEDRRLQREQWRKDHPQGKLAAYISDAGKCERAIYYSLHDYPETNPPGTDSLVNFAVGHAAEQVFAEKFALLGIPTIREVRVEIPWGPILVTGRSDFLIVMESLSCIVEFKTTKYRAMRKMIRSGEEGDPNHRKQLRGYMLAGKLNLLKPWGITPDNCETGVLCYVVKDATLGQQSFYSYDVDFDWDDIEATMNDLEVVSTATAVPPRPRGFQIDKFPCPWCSYKDGCWTGSWPEMGGSGGR